MGLMRRVSIAFRYKSPGGGLLSFGFPVCLTLFGEADSLIPEETKSAPWIVISGKPLSLVSFFCIIFLVSVSAGMQNNNGGGKN